jgi:thiol:disulfide interchange protein
MMNMKYRGGFTGFFSFVLLFTSYLTPFAAKAQQVRDDNKQIYFIEDDWDAALKQAAIQHKYIFVDAYATWCGPCKMLKATTFRNKKAAEFYNKNFVNIAIDMEKGIGPQLAMQWRMQAYPTLIIFNYKGEPVLGTVGYIKAPDLIRFGEAALKK